MDYHTVKKIYHNCLGGCRHRLPRVEARAPAALKLTGERAPHARHPLRYRYMRQWLYRQQRSNRLVNPIQKISPGSTEGPTTGCNATSDRGKKCVADASTALSNSSYFDELTPGIVSNARLTVHAAFLAAIELSFCRFAFWLQNDTEIDARRPQAAQPKILRGRLAY